MIIYIEGVDGSGKTTLLNMLAEKIDPIKIIRGIELIKDANKFIPTLPTVKDRVSSHDLVKEIKRMASDDTTIYLVDRGPISDIIYRTFDEYKPVIDLDDIIKLLKPLIDDDRVLVLFCDSDKAYSKMLDRGDNNKIAITHHKQLRYLFNNIMPLFSNYKVDMFSNDKDVYNLIYRIIAYISAVLWLRKDGVYHI